MGRLKNILSLEKQLLVDDLLLCVQLYIVKVSE